jgi:uncharacterized protein (TIGR02145 family)
MFYKSILNAVAVVVAVVAVMFVGCGGDDDDNGGGGGGGGGGGNDYTYTGRTVTLGGNVWMAENLNRATADSKCYDNDASNCITYGRMYTWDDAMNACPSGWHLPDTTDWRALVNAAGESFSAGKKLKSTSGWKDDGNGTDDYGFTALPGGYTKDGFFKNKGESGWWWTSEECGETCRRQMTAHYDEEGFGLGGINKQTLCYVRCVKD